MCLCVSLFVSLCTFMLTWSHTNKSQAYNGGLPSIKCVLWLMCHGIYHFRGMVVPLLISYFRSLLSLSVLPLICCNENFAVMLIMLINNYLRYNRMWRRVSRSGLMLNLSRSVVSCHFLTFSIPVQGLDPHS